MDDYQFVILIFYNAWQKTKIPTVPQNLFYKNYDYYGGARGVMVIVAGIGTATRVQILD